MDAKVQAVEVLKKAGWTATQLAAAGLYIKPHRPVTVMPNPK